MMKWLLFGIGGLVALLVGVWLMGALLPTHHVATVQVSVPQAPERVFAAVVDVQRAPEWRSDLQRVEILSPPGAPLRWRESTRFGDITMVRDAAEPPDRVVSRIDDPGQPFGGRWIFEFAPQGDVTLVTITEEGDVHNPFFRFMSRYVFGHYRTLETYAADLARHLGAPRPVVRRAEGGTS